MEQNEKKVTSCLMLAANLETPVSLATVFDAEDLKDTGIEFDSHITILYARNKYLEKRELLKNVISLCETQSKPNLFDRLKDDSDAEEFSVPVFDLFELGSFENDSGYVVLKLKKEGDLFEKLEILNKGLMKIYGITSDFPSYTPHLTLAELEPGRTEKYMNSETLQLILKGSMVHLEDFIVSYDKEGEDGFDVHNLTTHCAVERFFRIRELKRDYEELQKM